MAQTDRNTRIMMGAVTILFTIVTVISLMADG